jgi:hypothetical protein
MHSALRAPPWGDLWRHLVTTVLFTFLLVLAVGVLTPLDRSPDWPALTWGLAAVAYLAAAVVVWSDLPWPGDT